MSTNPPGRRHGRRRAFVRRTSPRRVSPPHYGKDRMDVVVWHMRHNPANWNLLRAGNELDADLQLLCEATEAPQGFGAIGQWRTVGLADALPLDRPVVRKWSTAV